jgi:alpha-beta hydrolase superfamily lysophospholipase
MATRLQLDVPAAGAVLRMSGHDVASPRGTLVIVPGFAEHSGRWTRVQDELASRGYASYAFDPRGHGRSGGARGHTPGWGALLDDLSAVFHALEKERRLRGAVGLLGASMGGLLAIEWAVRHRERIKALALVSPFLAPALSIPPHKLLLAHTLGRALPRLAQAHGMRGKSLSHDPAVIAQYDGDPLQTRVMTARYFLEMRAAQERVRALGPKIELPVLVLAGAADPVASVPAMEAWARTVPEGRCRLLVFPGLLHEPLNEPERLRVFGELVRWLDFHVVGQARPGP